MEAGKAMLGPPFQGRVTVRIPLDLTENALRQRCIVFLSGDQPIDQQGIELIQPILILLCDSNRFVGISSSLLQFTTLHGDECQCPQSVVDILPTVALSCELQRLYVRPVRSREVMHLLINVSSVSDPGELIDDVVNSDRALLGLKGKL